MNYYRIITFIEYYEGVSDEVFIKIEPSIKRKIKKLINVCAWCPKNTYPKLAPNEDYTHGLCDKHYMLLRQQK